MPKWMVIIDYEVEATDPLEAVRNVTREYMSNISVMRFDPAPAPPKLTDTNYQTPYKPIGKE